MGRALVDQLLYLLDDGFEGGEWHSLLGNLRRVTAEDWGWVPPGGHRSVRAIVGHVGACKWMYENHAFGDGALTWDDPLVAGAALDHPEPAIAWLRRSQARLRASIAALDDAELLRPRRTNWGALEQTRWIVAAMIQHDLYHAGEINHLRSLRQQDDRWAHERSD
ncbi:MAG TPA: DinB family protein [Chloroflexota bacterium]|nr:DinB family protein [Chloroflexota bacterium]